MTDTITIEVDIGSVTTWDRPPSRWYLVRIRRGKDYEIVATGLTRSYADGLAERLTKLLG